MKRINLERVIPVVLWDPQKLNNRRHDNSWKPKVGVLMTITGHGTIPPEEGTPRHWNRGNSTPHHYYTPRRNGNPLAYPAASHSCSRGASWGNDKKKHNKESPRPTVASGFTWKTGRHDR
ncbi:hypothetical protein AVEN_101379-1 [Araneus ventricosus]|uniref:Uncharacterized protein n=1 Tax=Araneus ventricosus TaxID=182803 RepID=A0A4Y2PHK2_ARAVE|nr:hypothetical protein AVEN_101379-1 [Araneus ventricosus]